MTLSGTGMTQDHHPSEHGGLHMRPLTVQDIPRMQELFRTTVLTVNSRDYTEEEVKDWASCGDSVEHWKELLSANSYIGATDIQGNIIGFSSMNSDGHLHSMFVHKDWQGKGVAGMLLAEVEKMARQYGIHKIVSEVSITARPFFEKRGYRVVAAQKAKANKLFMTNYRMEKEMRICQSCGLPMPSEDLLGTHGDGHPCTEYCRNCFQKGLFTSYSIDEQRKAISASERKETLDLRTLKRWMPVMQQAAWILDRCGYVFLSTIDGNGFPRPVAIDVLRHDGIAELWMTTALSSEKVKHLRTCPKAGICFVYEADSVTLTGTAEIVTDKKTLHTFWRYFMIHYFPQGPDDPDYCILRFHTREATLWIDRKSACFELSGNSG